MTKRKKVVLRAKWQAIRGNLPWTTIQFTKALGYHVSPHCRVGKRLHRAFGTKPRKLRIMIEEV